MSSDQTTEAAIRLGVVGLGRGFMLTLPALREHHAIRLVAAYDPRMDASDHFAATFDALAHSSLESLLADQAVDAVYIASPHHLHAAQAIAAAKAGKHILVEKPMATSIADCAAMVTAAEKNGVTLMVGPSHGFDLPVEHAAAMIATDQFGPVRMVTALNFTDFLYRPRRCEELDDNQGGGVIYSQAAHQIDVIRRLVGQRVATMRAVAGNWDPARASKGAYTALMTFAGGAAASLTYSGYGHYDTDELVGWVSELGRDKDHTQYGEARRALATRGPDGEERAKLSRTFGAHVADAAVQDTGHHEHFGFVLVSCERGDLRLTPRGLWTYGDEERVFIPISPPAVPRMSVVEAFAAAVRGRRATFHDGRWGLITTACCTALALSSGTAAEVAIDALIPGHGTSNETVEH